MCSKQTLPIDFRSRSPRLRSLSIAVIGDYCIDKYLRTSPTPKVHDYSALPTIEVNMVEHYPGGAGNVALNLLSLGVNVHCVGAIGDDGDGYDLIKSLNENGAKTDHMFSEQGRKTVACIRPVSQNESDFNIHEFMCLNQSEIKSDTLRKIEQALGSIIESVDAIIIIEQFEKIGNGILHPQIKKLLGELSQKHPKKIILVDSREHIDSYENIFLKCNQYEFAAAVKSNFCTESELLGALFAKKNKALFLTKGENGMTVITPDSSSGIPAIPTTGELYTCGAGDSATAGIVIGLLLGYNYNESALLGNLVASITIQKLGTTGSATIEEVLHEIEHHENFLLV